MGKRVSDFIFGGSKITADGDCSHEIKRCLLLRRKVMINLDSILNSRHNFANKHPSSQGYGFSSSRVWMWELDYKEIRALNNWCFWTVVLEKTLESEFLGLQGDPTRPFIGRTDGEAETPILWPPDAKKWLTWKDPDAGKDWRQEEKVAIEDEMAGHEFGWTSGVGDGQGGLACCSPWGRRVWHDWATESLASW